MKKTVLKLWRKYSSLLLILILFIVPSLYFYIQEPKPLVIFAGGGSVCNFINSIKHIDIKNPSKFTNHVYINLPSEYVQKMLEEEIIRFADDERNNPGQPVFSYSCNGGDYEEWKYESHHPFLYIGLSAKSLKINYSSSYDIAQVYEDFIGYDTLVAYTDDIILNKTKSDTITIDSLRTLITKDCKDKANKKNQKDTTICEVKNNVYATSRLSGTFHAYEKAFSALGDSINLNGLKLFFENDPIPNGSIVLSSVYYPPKSYKKFRYYLTDSNGAPLIKPHFIYFVAYRDSKGKFKPNSQVINFLHKIHQDSVIVDENWERENDKINVKRLIKKKK